ncbi:MAG: phospholipid carrier-dependent glycosyltransferase [Candidatus Shapirobacteria bacterium]
MNRFAIILITVLALGVRLFNSSYPPLLWDEASLGYNAYSILETGKDEYGATLPLVFKSFGDYKPGLYVYLTIPFVAIFGLNPLSVRLPSIILGSLLPLLIYLLILKLSPKSKQLALITALLISFNPWNIHFSRGAWETNVLLFELALATLLFVNQKLIWSSLIFGLTFYTYQGGKIMTPLLLSILFFTHLSVFKSFKNILRLALPLILLSLPIIYGLVTQNDANRLSVYALWNYHRPTNDTRQIIGESNQLNYNIFHNEAIFFVQNFLTRYFNHFSPKFLIFEGDWQIQRHSAPYIGVILYPSIIFVILGIFSTLVSSLKKPDFIFLLWLIIGPLPGALTKDSIQPVRTLSLSIPLMYFAAKGIIFTFNKIKSILIPITIFSAYLVSFIYYQDLYYHHMTKVSPAHLLYGYQEAAKYVIDHGKDKQVTFTDFYGQPYIYYLFYSKYPPRDYQAQASLTVDGKDTGKISKIDNIKFEVPSFSFQKTQPKQVLILSYDDAIRQGIDLKTLTPLSPINNTSTFYAYETN